VEQPFRSPRFRFGTFDVDLQAGELRKKGLRLKLTRQAFQVLTILLERPGEVVTREEIQKRLWPDTFVDFEQNLNTAIKKLREVLDDSAENSRFVETLPRRGYRFIAPVEKIEALNQGMPLEVSIRRPKHYRALLTVGLLLAATLSTIVAYRVFSRPHVPLDPITVVPFTTYPGFEGAPSFSPDGNQLAFAWSKEGLNFDLYVKQVGQERAVQLTYRPATYVIPAWSPDGRFIAFGRRGKEDRDTGIYLVPALGGSERKLADAAHRRNHVAYFLSWSPDGRWLAFSKEDASLAIGEHTSPEKVLIHLLDVETGEQRVLPNPFPDCALNLEPAFSPDGKYMAAVCMLTDGVNRIYIQAREGGQAREVVLVKGSSGFLGGSLEGLAWAADSESLLYGSLGHLWRVGLAGGTPDKLLFAQDVQTPAVAHTGNRLAFAQVSFPANIWKLDFTSPTELAGPATKVIGSSRGEWNLRTSPDGKHIAFESRRSGRLQIWVCDRDGSNPIQVSYLGEDRVPSWSPDSRRLAFDSRASGKAEIYIVNADGGQPHRLSTGTPNAASPRWSRNGQWIYFVTQQPDGTWKVPTDGGTPIRLMKEGRYDAQESVDGARIFFVVGYHEGDKVTEQIWSALADGGDERLETPMVTNASWDPARDGIYFLDGVDSSGRNCGRLRFFDFASRHLRTLMELESGASFPGHMSVSRDGHTIFYAMINQRSADLMLVEGFR
jgi:Tol biopolymer transport system component/DNA-binding winged helix-turn-helix (wHTH) protein